ncbi:MAG: transcriptional repressor [Candidatus Omnitrophota bacterium]
MLTASKVIMYTSNESDNHYQIEGVVLKPTGKEFFQEFLKQKQIKKSRQRDIVLDIFLSTERHLTIAQLYDLVRKKYPQIGYATVYRAINLIQQAGVAERIDFGDGLSRFERKYGQEQHDHLICIECGKFVEIVNSEVKKIQEKIAKENGFILKKHKIQLQGLCNKCNRKNVK